MLKKKTRSLLASAMVVAGVAAGLTATTTGTAQAASDCGAPITGLPLEVGDQGTSVKRVQERVAGFVDYGEVLSVDGVYGSRTAEAVKKFQRAYGLAADGVVGPNTRSKIYSLQSSDCTPIHFSYSELNKCNSTWSGGKVSATTAKRNARRTMWKLEAIRHKLGDNPITITSGFRSESCNTAVGGSKYSRHMYGDAADMWASTVSKRCSYAIAAKRAGFREILSQGYKGHNDHTHVGNTSSRFWAAPNCSGF
ncbi:D-Ala-D-Ala carboxypeptidase family metallohydrolase [Streptomyces sp. KLOTTS4A1]|uniref:D-Ala-D-Ala carboxypeptidase family metallohydrolase n=1 Tax=Streptomyces sp. KLOTTS4A1 TaxID=3390996 RepID=UPI0039F6277E